MVYDLSRLTALRHVSSITPDQAALVNALRYTHIALHVGRYFDSDLVQFLRSPRAIRPFRIFLNHASRAWPDPIQIHAPCRPVLTYDEVLIGDITAAAATNHRETFDRLLEDMVSARLRPGLWAAACNLMKCLTAAPINNEQCGP